MAADQTRNLRIDSDRPMPRPEDLLNEFPLDETAAQTVTRARRDVTRILDGDDDRLLVVAGPCSTHDPEAALHYAARLRDAAADLADDLCIVMRAYLEKPRTTVGWKGLVTDPHLDGTCASDQGVRVARQLLLELGRMGVPAGCEFLDPLYPHYLADAVSWGAIGARTVESQLHRQLASGLSMPVGLKNGTDGNVQSAIDGLRAAGTPQTFLGVSDGAAPTIVNTSGNDDTHLILRGGRGGPNYGPEDVEDALRALGAAGLPQRVVIDASHGNSGKDHTRQPHVADSIAAQLAGSPGAGHRAEDGRPKAPGIVGVMLESFLVEGRQDLLDPAQLRYGQSVTDSCMGWEMTEPVLHKLAAAVRARRARSVPGVSRRCDPAGLPESPDTSGMATATCTCGSAESSVACC